MHPFKNVWKKILIFICDAEKKSVQTNKVSDFMTHLVETVILKRQIFNRLQSQQKTLKKEAGIRGWRDDQQEKLALIQLLVEEPLGINCNNLRHHQLHTVMEKTNESATNGVHKEISSIFLNFFCWGRSLRYSIFLFMVILLGFMKNKKEKRKIIFLP